jgi:hypothetical protein
MVKNCGLKGNKSAEKLCAASVLKEYVETNKKRDNEAATQDSPLSSEISRMSADRSQSFVF